MRALVVIAGTSPFLQALNPRLPACLVPCVDRPILQHVVESLIDRGIDTFDFVLHEFAREIEEFLGDGARWGSHFTFHLVCDPTRPYEPLRLLPKDDRAVLLLHADRLPLLPDRCALEQQSNQDALLYVSTEGALATATQEWTGSAILRSNVIESLRDGATRQQLEQHLRRIAGEEAIAEVQVLDFNDFQALLAAQRGILEGAQVVSHLAAREIEPGIWIARNVTIHPTAQLTAPVFIGENSRIGCGSKIGPNAVIGHDSIVDQYTEVIDSAVLPGSYCGEHLELDHVIIDRNRLVSSKHGAAVDISDTFILSGLRTKSRRNLFRFFFSRFLAALLLLLTLPLTLLTVVILLIFRRTPLVYRKRVVRLPLSEGDTPPHTFNLYSLRNSAAVPTTSKVGWVLLDFLPSLGQVVMGNLQLVGLSPRTEEEIRRMPRDWRTLYVQGHSGLLTEALVIHGPAANEDEVYSCEAYYTAVHGVGHDLSLALRFITGPLWVDPGRSTSAERSLSST